MTFENEARRKLTITETLFKQMGMLYSRFNYGESCSEFNEEMLRILGVSGFFAWAGAAGGALDPLMAKYGAFTAQFLTGFVAMLNGCTYCGKGHLYAANLHYYKNTGKLLGLDEMHVYWLQRQRDADVMEELRRVLTAADEPDTLRLVERLFVIKTSDNGEPTPDDPWLSAINGAWDWATECSIMLNIIDVPALDSIGKDKTLVKAYQAERAAWREENSEHPGHAVKQPWQAME